MGSTYINDISIVNFEPTEHTVLAFLILTDAVGLPVLFHWFLDYHPVGKHMFKTIHENHRLTC